MNSIEIYNLLSRTFLILAILFAALTIFLGFHDHIREIFMIKTGRAQKITTNQMNKRNMETGRLQTDYSFEANTETGTGKRTTFLNRTNEQKTPETTTLHVQNTGQTPKQRNTASQDIQKAPVNNRSDFKITENVMIIHTNETIE